MIEAKILYAPTGDLAAAYRKQVLTSSEPWVLMVDHDVILATNPHWYRLCREAIAQAPDAGLFTCFTNVIGAPALRAPLAPVSWCFDEHASYAEEHFMRNGFSITDLTEAKPKISGFFMLLRREAVAVADIDGGPHKVRGGFFGVDWNLAAGIVAAGYRCYRIDGLYVAHMRLRRAPFIGGERTALSFNP